MLRAIRLAVIVVAATAATHPQSESPSAYKVEAVPASDGKSTVPASVPAAIAQGLATGGLRVIGADGKTLCELWPLAELPIAAPAAPNAPRVSSVALQRLLPGSLVGVMKTFGTTSDYRDQTIEAGIYGLRYFHQPSDGNHLGTADTRDFFVLTCLTEDKDPAPIADQDALVALAVPVSPSDHALVLYVAAATAEPAKDGAPRVVRRGEHDEWALELAFAAKANGATESEKLRVELVLVGHTAH